MQIWTVKIRRRCKRCRGLFYANSRNGKYCPRCSDFVLNNFFKLEDIDKAQRKLEKALMISSNAKIYGSSSYQPTVLEKAYFERKDPDFLKGLVSDV